MSFYCPVDSLSYLTDLMKRAKCSSLTIEHSCIKVNVMDLIQVLALPTSECQFFSDTYLPSISYFQAIRSLHSSEIPQELCLTALGNCNFQMGEFDPFFDLLSLKASSVSMAPVPFKDREDDRFKFMYYRYRFPAGIEGLALEATIGLRMELQRNALPDVFVRRFQYKFFRDTSNIRPLVNRR